MNRIERLAQAVEQLGNHVAAVVRISNAMDSLLKDAIRGVTLETKDAIFAMIKDMHDKFRVEHFRGIISTLNVAIDVSDKLWAEEPVLGGNEDEDEEKGAPVETLAEGHDGNDDPAGPSAKEPPEKDGTP